MAEESTFKCLRCGYEYKAPYTKGAVEERTCPKCGSNSVRHIGKKRSNKNT